MSRCTFPANLFQPKTTDEEVAWCNKWIEHLEQEPNESWLAAWDQVLVWVENRTDNDDCFFKEWLQKPHTQWGTIRKLQQLRNWLENNHAQFKEKT